VSTEWRRRWPRVTFPFVVRLLERGDIPSELLPESRHRRIRLEDVLAFQTRRERRAEGRRRIAERSMDPEVTAPTVITEVLNRKRKPIDLDSVERLQY
jgi:hypothetical protein